MELLTRLAEDPGQAAVLLDVDGTLAPIVARPEDARVPDEAKAELARLAARYGLVACISGRPEDDLARLVDVPGVRLVGEHGLGLDARSEREATRVHEFADTVAWPAERKRFSVSFHYRNEPDEEAAVRTLAGVAERAVAEGLSPRWGRKVLEIRPVVDAHKGTAVRALLAEAGLRRALFAGDDTTDLDAFAALDGLELAVRVAVSSEEGPAELGVAADIVVGSTDALLELLHRL